MLERPPSSSARPVRRASRARVGSAILLAALVAASCREAETRAAPPFLLEQVRPRREQRVGVFLNEALVFHFSAPVDPASVTGESLAVRELERGRAARGRYEVEADHVRFLPELGRERDLSDGGFVPGRRYQVMLRGFPSPDGLRSSDGRVLSRSHAIELETVALSEPRGQMFDDHSPLMGEPLIPESRRVERGESLVLRCAEPLDPSTLVDGEFVLRRGDGRGEPVPLDLRLLENSHERGARLELKPRRRLEPGGYFLPSNLEVSVRDFGGNIVWYATTPGVLQIEVYDLGEVRPEFIESFTSTDLSLPFAVPGVDGTATWSGDGRVTFRLPRAAGSGADGEQRLEGAEGRRELQATGLELFADDRCELLTTPGLVVLRAQGRLAIHGTLTRRSGPGQPRRPRAGRSLSDWIEAAAEDPASWTVLVAGGDLVIDGRVDVDGPLLLAAGGRIRVSGEVRAQEHELYYVGEGGGPSLRTADRVRLEFEAPYENPLAAPMTLALVSGPMPPEGGVARWKRAEVELLDRRGTARVRFMPEDFSLQAPLEEWGIVEDPSELIETEALRLFIELRMEPADPEDARDRIWDPPLVDEVRLFWEARPR